MSEYKKGQEWLIDLTQDMLTFEQITGKKAVYNNKITGQFEYWLWQKEKGTIKIPKTRQSKVFKHGQIKVESPKDAEEWKARIASLRRALSDEDDKQWKNHLQKQLDEAQYNYIEAMKKNYNKDTKLYQIICSCGNVFDIKVYPNELDNGISFNCKSCNRNLFLDSHMLKGKNTYNFKTNPSLEMILEEAEKGPDEFLKWREQQKINEKPKKSTKSNIICPKCKTTMNYTDKKVKGKPLIKRVAKCPKCKYEKVSMKMEK